MLRRWTSAEDEALLAAAPADWRDRYRPGSTIHDLAKRLGRTVGALYTRRSRLGAPLPIEGLWTEREDQAILAGATVLPGRKARAIAERRQRLELRQQVVGQGEQSA